MNLSATPAAAIPVSDRERMVRNLFPDAALGQLVNGVTDALYRSFIDAGAPATTGMAAITLDEKRRRFKICMDWALVLRGDLKWGVQRICDAMPEILKITLAGNKWDPPTRQCWIPSDGR
jgi:hypothetical protein